MLTVEISPAYPRDQQRKPKTECIATAHEKEWAFLRHPRRACYGSTALAAFALTLVLHFHQALLSICPRRRLFSVQHASISGSPSIANQRDPPPTASHLRPAPSKQPSHRSCRLNSVTIGRVEIRSAWSSWRDNPAYASEQTQLAPPVRTSSLSYTPRAVHVGTRA
ncbi:hypothetical protein IW262DRAFT_665335 [Armillaria fumosa]|nr:hypothetical protein IW262DRAFT_665335 [Armillaria fumosa]